MQKIAHPTMALLKRTQKRRERGNLVPTEHLKKKPKLPLKRGGFGRWKPQNDKGVTWRKKTDDIW